MRKPRKKGELWATIVLLVSATVGMFSGMVVFPTETSAMVSLDYEAASATYSLSAGEWAVYRQFHDQCVQIYNGQRTSTKLEFDAMSLYGVREWSVDDYDVEPVLGGQINIEFGKIVVDIMNRSISNVIAVLVREEPDLAAWINSLSSNPIDVAWRTIFEGGRWKLTIDSAALNIEVCPGFQGTEQYEVSPAAIQRIRDSVAYAQTIVDRHAGESPMTRLNSYKDEILALSSYDKEAGSLVGDGMLPSDYGYQWQLTSVFDRDSSTLSVCEGYSKAFKLLVDLTGDPSIRCYNVIGKFSCPGTPPTNHMWNVVRMPDGRNYLADITNSAAGTAAERGDLFIVPASGSVDSGYKIEIVGFGTVRYVYDTKANEDIQRGILVLSDMPYAESSTPASESRQAQKTDAPQGGEAAPQSDNQGIVHAEEEVPDVAVSPQQEETVPERQFVIEDEGRAFHIAPDLDAGKTEGTKKVVWVPVAVELLMIVDVASGLLVVLLAGRKPKRKNAAA